MVKEPRLSTVTAKKGFIHLSASCSEKIKCFYSENTKLTLKQGIFCVTGMRPFKINVCIKIQSPKEFYFCLVGKHGNGFLNWATGGTSIEPAKDQESSYKKSW